MNTAKLRIKAPDTDEGCDWLRNEIDNYTAAVGYVSYFIESRARMGDLDTVELFDEFKANVCQHMRGGFDVLGEQ